MADEIIHEVEESLKQERLEKLWKENGTYILLGAFLIVLCTGLLNGWRSWENKVNINHTELVVKAIEGQDKVRKLSSLAVKVRPGHRAITRLTAAGLLLEEKKYEEALLEYQGAASDRELDPVFRDLAQLMYVRLKWSTQETPSDSENLLSLLEPIWKSPSNPWQIHAHIQASLIYAHDKNDFRSALSHLEVVRGTKNLAPTLSERVEALEHIYKYKQENAAVDNGSSDVEG